MQDQHVRDYNVEQMLNDPSQDFSLGIDCLDWGNSPVECRYDRDMLNADVFVSDDWDIDSDCPF